MPSQCRCCSQTRERIAWGNAGEAPSSVPVERSAGFPRIPAARVRREGAQGGCPAWDAAATRSQQCAPPAVTTRRRAAARGLAARADRGRAALAATPADAGGSLRSALRVRSGLSGMIARTPWPQLPGPPAVYLPPSECVVDMGGGPGPRASSPDRPGLAIRGSEGCVSLTSGEDKKQNTCTASVLPCSRRPLFPWRRPAGALSSVGVSGSSHRHHGERC